MILHNFMAKNLFLKSSLVLFLGFTAHKALSWKDQSSVDDIGAPCPPQPHPLAMCQSQKAAFGYPCEDHKVTTKDGYILGLQRIPHGRSHDGNSAGKTRPAVLLFHGLMVDGVVWVLSTPKQSLGFVLADTGFDVWIANCRGTKSSRNHTSLSTKDPAYWEWSWDEIAAYDLPAVLQYVYDYTGRKKVHYIGHSLGTLVILAAFSEHKLLNMVRSAAMLCPIAYLGKIKSKLALLGVRIFLANTVYWLGFHEFNPVGSVAREILSKICNDPNINCYDLFSALAGPDCCLNTSTACSFLEHAPQPTSVRNLIHLSQMIRHGEVRRYNYGNQEDNMKHYNQKRPPLYNLSSIPTHLPLFLAHGGQDFLGDVPDTRHLVNLLVSNHDSEKIEVLFMPAYAHADFVIGYNAPDLIFKLLVSFFNRH